MKSEPVLNRAGAVLLDSVLLYVNRKSETKVAFLNTDLVTGVTGDGERPRRMATDKCIE
jgi:hypothetical protein